MFGDRAPQVPTAAEGTPAVGLRLVALNGKVQKVKIPYRDGMLVHDALEQAEVFKRFKKVKISLRRIVPETQKLAKMQVNLEKGRKEVALGSDYALFERDILEVTEENSDWGTDMLRSALGPIGTVVLPE
ncbi:MAG TPA: hypothetical protein DCE55_10380 [Planctomycetaceae bacterium]|nr:hypothetical protein [Planctomycetaceae bacterium]|tara:strand:+ start:1516 stop:1905 length:390 start_codon:yes stop_codon:yes gene_type:complete